MEQNTKYANSIDAILSEEPTFGKIYRYNIDTYSRQYTPVQIFSELSNGTRIIPSRDLLKCYMATYGGHHYYKLQISFKSLFTDLLEKSVISIIDYGCGQALASTIFLDYVIRNNISLTVNEILLIEPSDRAVERGELHLSYFLKAMHQTPNINVINKSLDDVSIADLSTDEESIKIHLFSNILDVTSFDLNVIYEKIMHSQKGLNYFVCVGPYNSGSQRLIYFDNLFQAHSKISIKVPSQQIFHRVYDIYQQNFRSNYPIAMLQRIFRCNF